MRNWPFLSVVSRRNILSTGGIPTTTRRPRDRASERAEDRAGDGHARLHDLLDRKRAGLRGRRSDSVAM